MPWYETAYDASRKPVDARRLNKEGEKYYVGLYGNFVFAPDRRTARRLLRKRNMGEALFAGEVKRPHYPRASTAMRKRGFNRDVLHNMTFTLHMALKSGVAAPEDVTGDAGILHEYIHGAPRKPLIAKMIEIEKKIPGYLGPRFK